MSHSCRRMRVADHLTGRSAEMLALYRHVLTRVRAIGPIRLDPQGRGISFQVRARSIGVAFHPTWLELTLWLKREASHPRLTRAERFGALGNVFHFRLERPQDLDPALGALLVDAYAIGAQAASARAPARRSARTSRQ